MKQIIFISAFLACTTCLYSQSKGDAFIIKQRALLKEYGLCKCLSYGFKNDNLLKRDFSTTVLVEQLNYSPIAYFGVDSLMRKFADSIPVSNYIDAKGKRGIMINCINYYNSKRFALYIRRLDRYLPIK